MGTVHHAADIQNPVRLMATDNIEQGQRPKVTSAALGRCVAMSVQLYNHSSSDSWWVCHRPSAQSRRMSWRLNRKAGIYNNKAGNSR